MAAKESDGVASGTASLLVAEEAKELAGGAASLPEAQEASLAGQYNEMDINCGEMDISTGETGEEEEEILNFISRFKSLRAREERLAVISTDLRRIKEQRGSSAPTYIELAAFVLLRESAAATLEGLPTTLSVRSLFG
uniref:Uncharacterized protein n=1 Tax=Avena sativa TaxID=4498 RepID=A0ACD5UVB1_AVESA